MSHDSTSVQNLVVIAAIKPARLKNYNRCDLMPELSSDRNASRPRTYNAEIRMELSSACYLPTIDQHRRPNITYFGQDLVPVL
jgi:hypothetical protein